MKIGILGMGSMGRRRALILHELGHEVHAYDPVMKEDKYYKPPSDERGGVIPLYAAPEQVVREVDALIIASPPDKHMEGMRLGADIGIPCLVEKPLCMPQEIDKVPSNLKGMVGYSYRFHPQIHARWDHFLWPRTEVITWGYRGSYQKEYHHRIHRGWVLDVSHMLDLLTCFFGSVKTMRWLVREKTLRVNLSHLIGESRIIFSLQQQSSSSSSSSWPDSNEFWMEGIKDPWMTDLSLPIDLEEMYVNETKAFIKWASAEEKGWRICHPREALSHLQLLGAIMEQEDDNEGAWPAR